MTPFAVMERHNSLKEQFDVGNEKISELKRKNVKAESEMKLWRTKLENEAMPKIDEIEDENAKLRSKYDMNEKALVEFEAKILLLKKQKNKLLEDAKQSKDEAENERRKLEEKMKKLKEVLTLNEKLKIQIEDLKQDIESSRRHNILCNNELSQVKHENSNLRIIQLTIPVSFEIICFTITLRSRSRKLKNSIKI